MKLSIEVVSFKRVERPPLLGFADITLATVNVATLSVRVELAPSHVFDHTQTQRTDGVSIAHGELLPD